MGKPATGGTSRLITIASSGRASRSHFPDPPAIAATHPGHLGRPDTVDASQCNRCLSINGSWVSTAKRHFDNEGRCTQVQPHVTTPRRGPPRPLADMAPTLPRLPQAVANTFGGNPGGGRNHRGKQPSLAACGGRDFGLTGVADPGAACSQNRVVLPYPPRSRWGTRPRA